MSAAGRVRHLLVVWLANGILGGLLVAFFQGARRPGEYIGAAAVGLVIMGFIVAVIAVSNRWMRPRFLPEGVALRGPSVLVYTLCFLAVTAVATLLSFLVLDRTLLPGLLRNPHAVTTTLLYVLLFAALNIVSTLAVTFYRDVRVRVRTEARAEQEMRLAAEVQQALLPPPSGIRSRYLVAGISIPSRKIGGDFFDHFELGEDRLAFVLADVAGKGVPAALLAAAAQGMIRMASAPGRPSTTFQRVNEALSRTAKGRFITAFHGVLSSDGLLRFSNAGHWPGILLRTSGEVQKLDANGLMLGPFPQAEFEENELRLAPGDQVITFSDGVTEAVGADGQYFGFDRALEVIRSSPRLPPPDLVTRLAAAVQSFAGGRALDDDLTVLVVRYEG